MILLTNDNIHKSIKSAFTNPLSPQTIGLDYQFPDICLRDCCSMQVGDLKGKQMGTNFLVKQIWVTKYWLINKKTSYKFLPIIQNNKLKKKMNLINQTSTRANLATKETAGVDMAALAQLESKQEKHVERPPPSGQLPGEEEEIGCSKRIEGNHLASRVTNVDSVYDQNRHNETVEYGEQNEQFVGSQVHLNGKISKDVAKEPAECSDKNTELVMKNDLIQNVSSTQENNGNRAFEYYNKYQQEINILAHNYPKQSAQMYQQQQSGMRKCGQEEALERQDAESSSHRTGYDGVSNDNHKKTVADIQIKNKMAACSHDKDGGSMNHKIETQLHAYEAEGDDSDHAENVMILQHLSGSKSSHGCFQKPSVQKVYKSVPCKMNAQSDASSDQGNNCEHSDSDRDQLEVDLAQMRLNVAGINPGHQHQQDIQKLIEEVTKKEEKWTKEQDEKLVKLVAIYKVENIEVVSQKLNSFIDDQRSKATTAHQLALCIHKTEVECMDRWLLLRNNTEDGTVKQIKGNWTPEEDMILKNKVAEYGLKKWKEIATFLPGRIGKQCRERWYNNVDPNLNKDKWTIAEDLQLMELHKLYGNKWVQIQKHMPGRIDNDIKNRFNASLRKYKTFEQYVEANDRKREKSKKKYYWRQHYELRNVNNSKRLPLNEQDKEFKDMAQQKIQMEVGSNLPPLKNDLIIEKKKELEEYQELKKLKAKHREEKRLQKQREKSNRKRNQGCGYKPEGNIEITNFDVRAVHNISFGKANEVRNDIEFRGSEKYQSQDSPVVNPEQIPAREALKEINSIPSMYNVMNSQSFQKVTEHPKALQNLLGVVAEQRPNADNTSQLLLNNQLSLKNLCKDELFKQIFKVSRVSEDEIREMCRNQQIVNAFREFQSNRQYRELFMPTKKQEMDEQQDIVMENIQEQDLSRHSQKSQQRALEVAEEPKQEQKMEIEPNEAQIKPQDSEGSKKDESLNDSVPNYASKQSPETSKHENTAQKIEQVYEYIWKKALDIAKEVDTIAQKADQKALLKSLMSRTDQSKEDCSLTYQIPRLAVQKKRYELLKKVQEQLNAIKKIRERRDARVANDVSGLLESGKKSLLQKRSRNQVRSNGSQDLNNEAKINQQTIKVSRPTPQLSRGQQAQSLFASKPSSTAKLSVNQDTCKPVNHPQSFQPYKKTEVVQVIKSQPQNQDSKTSAFKHPGSELRLQSQNSIFQNLTKILSSKAQKPSASNLLLKAQSTGITTNLSTTAPSGSQPSLTVNKQASVTSEALQMLKKYMQARSKPENGKQAQNREGHIQKNSQ